MISSIMIAAWVGNKFAEVRVTTASRRTGGSGWWTRSATGWRWSRCTPGRRPSLSWLSRPESEFSSLIAAILREICSESIRTTKSMLEFGRGEWKQFSHLPLRHPLSGITSTLNWLSCGISLQRGWCGPWFECQNSHFLFFHHVTIYIHNWFTEVLVSSFEHSNTYRDEVDVIRRAFYYRSFNFSFFFTASRFTLLCTLLVYGLTGEVKTLCQNLSGLQLPLSTS